MDLFQVLNQMRSFDGTPSSDENLNYVGKSHLNRTALAQFSIFHKIATHNSHDDRDSYSQYSGTDRPDPDHIRREINLADQFTWGSVVCAGIFVVVFLCVTLAWWVQKRRGPVDPEGLQFSNHESCESNPADLSQQKPPSYSEVVTVQEVLPPSYSEAIIICKHCNSTLQGFDNAGIDLDETNSCKSGQGPTAGSREDDSEDDCIVITVKHQESRRPSNC